MSAAAALIDTHSRNVEPTHPSWLRNPHVAARAAENPAGMRQGSQYL